MENQHQAEQAPASTILVVDDTPAIVQLLRTILESDGFDVAIAVDGEAAIAQVQASQPNLVLLDVMMPEIDGFEVCRQLQANPTTQTIPVLFMTALDDTVTKVKGLELGAVDYITKPFEAEEVLARVKVHLRLQQLSRTLEHQNQQLHQEMEARIQAQVALQQSEALYQFYRQTPVMLHAIDTQGRLVHVSDYWLEKMEYHRQEVLGQPASAFLTESSRRYVQAVTMPSLFRTGAVQNVPYEFVKKNGDVMEVELSAVVEWDANGHPIHGLAVLTDVTERKQAERALHESEDRFYSAFEYAAIGVALVSEDGHWLQVNPFLCEMLGYSEPELLATTVEALTHPEDITTERAHRRSMLAGSTQSSPTETRYRHQRGQVVWGLLSVSGVRNAEGHFLYFVYQIQDITERKQAEIALQTKTEELDQFFTLTLDLLCIANTDGYFLRLNHQWEATLGYPLSALEGRQCLDFVHPEDMERTLAALATLKQGQQTLNFINRYRCHDGSYRWLEWRAVPNGPLVYAASRDITERKQAEQAMKQQLAAIEAAIDGIAILKGDIFLHINQAHLSLFGYQYPEELVGHSWTQLYDSAEIDRFDQEVFPALLRDRAWQGEAIAKRKDGSTFAEGLSLTLFNRRQSHHLCLPRY